MSELDIPAQIIVDNLRNEVARLNDERLTLSIKLNHAMQIIASYEAQAEAAKPSENAVEETDTPA